MVLAPYSPAPIITPATDAIEVIFTTKSTKNQDSDQDAQTVKMASDMP